MSKRSNRRTNTVDKQEIQRMIDSAIARRFTPPAGANVTPISDSIINTMMQQQAPQSKSGGMWEPGAPIKPVPGLAPPQGPRQWSYQYGYNIGQLPRSSEMTAFDTLRNLAKLYEIIPMCEQVWFDLAGKLKLEIGPKPKHTVDQYGEPIDPKVLADKYGERIKRWEDFFAMPDPDNEQELHPWMQMLLKERLEIDAIALFKRRDRLGRLYGLEPFDGATLKPLLNERGRKPSGDFPAYEQFIHGTPAMFLRRSEVIYNREIEQINSPYGFSRVEYIVLRVNQALRKENKDLAYFTDGNVPPGLLMPPDDGTTDWTPEQLLMYQAMWDGMLAGNDAVRSRIKVAPPGSVYTKLEPDDIMVPFDDFLMTVTCGAFGVPKTELSFTEKSNRSTGETQEAVIYRRPLATIMKLFSGIMNKVMAEEGDGDLEATWKGYEEPEDFKVKAEAEDILVKNGTMSTSQGARWLGVKPMIETEPFVMSKDGPIFLKDAMDEQLRAAQLDAKTKGLQQSMEAPNEQGTQPGTKGAQSGAGGAKGTASGATGKQTSNGGANATGAATRHLSATVPGQSSDAERAERTIDAETTQMYGEANSSQSPQGTGTNTANAGSQGLQKTVSRVQESKTESAVQSGFLQDQRASAERAAEYRRWRERALKDVKEGKQIRPFISTLIPVDEHLRIYESLQECKTADEVREVFRAKPQDAEIIGAEPELVYDAQYDIYEAADIDEQLDALRAQGDEIIWEAHVSASGVCPTCKPNDGVRRKIGERFPSGHRLPQVHGHCQCNIRIVK